MQYIKILFLIFCLSLIFWCEKDKNPISTNIGHLPFPMKTGSTWEYEITDTTFYTYFADSMKINNGILKVKILNSIILGNGKRATIWQYNFQNTLDSLYVLSSGDSIIFYKNKEYPDARIVLIFPLSVSNEWERVECDKYKVLSKDTLNLPIGKITDVVKVEQNYACEVEAGLVNNYYIRQDIGIVKYHSNYMNIHYGIKRNKEWILNSYSINE
jgi:hypothetical protein